MKKKITKLDKKILKSLRTMKTGQSITIAKKDVVIDKLLDYVDKLQERYKVEIELNYKIK